MRLTITCASVATMSHYILITLLFFVLNLRSLAAAVAYEDGLAGHVNPIANEVDLASLLTARALKQDTIMQEAVELLKSMQLAPSCNRLAVSDLISSCQSISGRPENQDTDIYLGLEPVRSLYAARLAVCELKEAKAAAPEACLALMVAPRQKRGILDFVRFSDPQGLQKSRLEACLQSLETRPQWWTSYSNSRQNAVVICQAARGETEKEELLELYRAIANQTVTLERGLVMASAVHAADIARQKQFMQEVETARARLRQDLGETISGFHRMIERASNGLNSYARLARETFESIFEVLHQGASSLEEKIQNGTAAADQLIHEMNILHYENIKNNQEMADAQRRDYETNKELALSLGAILNALGEGSLASLSQLNASLESLGYITQVLQNMHERLPGLVKTLNATEARAEHLFQVQSQQYEALRETSRLQEQNELRAKGTAAELNQTAVAAEKLSKTIDRIDSRYRLGLVLKLLRDLVWPLCSFVMWKVVAERSRPIAAFFKYLVGRE
ncbi:putative nuclear membrane fusion protein Kar5 [Aspergillus saccharolyticus JOP 1030-1]|uniref:Nuclear membrane fusion protein Kar5 n=1 Tax=Aspergillus saccharolyticus JOP 1030-1 TaxID=1450539 RepID=A0A318ZC76_9EURO|nr:hypothetical protein BP01DRAFT_392925 [Aspergillus saccharolyticus JOP 1030-1]PYH44127.1 hypothetical protein BP01DRAFT_392925 [Aspergillus saccharolyticus JOP 1030-1]